MAHVVVSSVEPGPERTSWLKRLNPTHGLASLISRFLACSSALVGVAVAYAVDFMPISVSRDLHTLIACVAGVAGYCIWFLAISPDRRSPMCDNREEQSPPTQTFFIAKGEYTSETPRG
jgi:hypothetical protein